MKMKKFVFSLTALCLAGISTIPTYAATTNSISHSSEVIQEIKSLEAKYGVELEVSYGKEPGCIEMNNIEELDNFINQIQSNANKPIFHEIEINPSNNSENLITARRADNVATYKWEEREIVPLDPDDLVYTKNIYFTYSWEKTSSGKVFTGYEDITSSMRSTDDLLMMFGIKGWNQTEKDCTFSSDSKKANVSVTGEFKYGINIGDLHVGLPVGEQTWGFTLRLK